MNLLILESIMKVRRLGDALRRSRPSPLLSFLAPSVPLSTWSSCTSQFPSSLVSTRTSSRIQNFAIKPSPSRASSTATAIVQDDAPENTNPTPNHEKPERLPSGGDTDSHMSDLLNAISPRRQSEAESTHTSSWANSSLARQPMTTSADRMRRAFQEDLRSPNHLKSRQGAIVAQMEGMTATHSPMLGQVLSNDMNARIKLPPLRPPVRLDAFIGRSEVVDPSRGLDLGRALRKMEIKLALNNVRGDFQKQRFHERAGLKRKRLKRVRWRRRFKEGFQAVVTKVQDMRRRGW